MFQKRSTQKKIILKSTVDCKEPYLDSCTAATRCRESTSIAEGGESDERSRRAPAVAPRAAFPNQTPHRCTASPRPFAVSNMLFKVLPPLVSAETFLLLALSPSLLCTPADHEFENVSVDISFFRDIWMHAQVRTRGRVTWTFARYMLFCATSCK